MNSYLSEDWSSHDTRPHIPNAETLVAMKEADEHLRQLESGEVQPKFDISQSFLFLSFQQRMNSNADARIQGVIQERPRKTAPT